MLEYIIHPPCLTPLPTIAHLLFRTRHSPPPPFFSLLSPPGVGWLMFASLWILMVGWLGLKPHIRTLLINVHHNSTFHDSGYIFSYMSAMLYSWWCMYWPKYLQLKAQSTFCEKIPASLTRWKAWLQLYKCTWVCFMFILLVIIFIINKPFLVFLWFSQNWTSAYDRVWAWLNLLNIQFHTSHLNEIFVLNNTWLHHVRDCKNHMTLLPAKELRSYLNQGSDTCRMNPVLLSYWCNLVS